MVIQLLLFLLNHANKGVNIGVGAIMYARCLLPKHIEYVRNMMFILQMLFFNRLHLCQNMFELCAGDLIRNLLQHLFNHVFRLQDFFIGLFRNIFEMFHDIMHIFALSTGCHPLQAQGFLHEHRLLQLMHCDFLQKTGERDIALRDLLHFMADFGHLKYSNTANRNDRQKQYRHQDINPLSDF